MLSLRSLLACAALAFAACGGSSQPAPATPGPDPAPTPTDPAPTPTEPAPAPALDLASLGQPCAEDGSCKAGTCTKYYGIAGPRGPQFSSCEIPCAKGETCPDGTACVTVADGPGQVCRPQ